jgi:DNA-directed RNA polymerase subunit RPC12/RpoP
MVEVTYHLKGNDEVICQCGRDLTPTVVYGKDIIECPDCKSTIIITQRIRVIHHEYNYEVHRRM